jgi:hypothetical protein
VFFAKSVELTERDRDSFWRSAEKCKKVQTGAEADSEKSLRS